MSEIQTYPGRTFRSLLALAPLPTLLLGLLLAAGCSKPPAAESSGGYGNFIHFDGITYYANDLSDGAKAGAHGIQPGPKFGEVRFKLEGTNKPFSKIENGDAGLLPAGTPVYELKGYAPSFRLAARRREELILYEAVTNPRAKRGRDLMDIAGKVSRIAVYSAYGAPMRAKELAVIEDPSAVGVLVDMVLESPIRRGSSVRVPGERETTVIFELEDGTATGGLYGLKSGALSTAPGRATPNIVTPEKFRVSMARQTSND